MTTSSLIQWLRQWRALREITRDISRQPAPRAAWGNGPIQRLLVLPPDPMTLVGARGDQAMLVGVVDELRDDNPSMSVIVGTVSAEADQAARDMGYTPLRIPPERSPTRWLNEQARRLGVDGAALLGADMMDGHYSPVFTARSLNMIDALARDGVRTTVVGFSFNETPSPVLREVFDGLSSATHLNVRDPVSHDRLSGFTRTPSTLVADAAFLLRADDHSPRVEALRARVQELQAAGHPVLGYNAHPNLVKSIGPGSVERLIARSVDAMAAATQAHGVRWVLLPHDYRVRRRDDICLSPIAQGLAVRGIECIHPDVPLSAAEIKGVVGSLDGVVSGRMHLAIATLGRAVPIACIQYQGKFEGLLNHFELSKSLMRSPTEALVEGELEGMIEHLVTHLPENRERIRRALPAVLAAARRNLEPLRAHMFETAALAA